MNDNTIGGLSPTAYTKYCEVIRDYCDRCDPDVLAWFWGKPCSWRRDGDLITVIWGGIEIAGMNAADLFDDTTDDWTKMEVPEDGSALLDDDPPEPA
ncbi:hypothetical protein AXA44_15455 [Rhodococcus sp. SC4]|nr:hypothetical protein AXA44_15455 [Rhodococcus sp. SC4]